MLVKWTILLQNCKLSRKIKTFQNRGSEMHTICENRGYQNALTLGHTDGGTICTNTIQFIKLQNKAQNYS